MHATEYLLFISIQS